MLVGLVVGLAVLVSVGGLAVEVVHPNAGIRQLGLAGAENDGLGGAENDGGTDGVCETGADGDGGADGVGLLLGGALTPCSFWTVP